MSIKHPHPHPATEQGFTLIEVLVSLVILVIGLVGMLQLILLGLSSNEGSHNYTRAVFIAENTLERVRANVSSGVTDINTLSEYELIDQDLETRVTVADLPSGYRVTCVTEGPPFQVRVRVAWDDFNASATDNDDVRRTRSADASTLTCDTTPTHMVELEGYISDDT